MYVCIYTYGYQKVEIIKTFPKLFIPSLHYQIQISLSLKTLALDGQKESINQPSKPIRRNISKTLVLTHTTMVYRTSKDDNRGIYLSSFDHYPKLYVKTQNI